MIRCTHKCDTCKAKIKDIRGFDICVYFGTLKNIYWDTKNFSGYALEYFGRKVLLYFYDDGLYLYDPITCWQEKENYKLIPLKTTHGSYKYYFSFGKKDRAWVVERGPAVFDKIFRPKD